MVNFNGNVLSGESLLFNQKNRGLRYGDALSETLRAIKGKLIFWEDHYLKLMASMRILRMEIPINFTMEFLEEQILNTVVKNGLEDYAALVDILIFRNTVDAIHPKNNQVSFLIDINELGSSEYPFKDATYEVELYKDFFVSGDMLATLDTNNKMLNTVGSIFAKENDYEDCLLLNHQKMVVGSLIGNLFLNSGNMIKTGPLTDGCKNTVVRDKIIKIINESEDFEFEESSISPFELQRADELFIANVEKGLIPITKYRKKEYGSSNFQKILKKLNEMAGREAAH